MGRSQFTFYASFASALSRIKKKADRADAYDAICNYALFGTEPDIEKLPDSAAIAFDLIKPTLDASKRKAESGKRGGISKQTGSKPEANRKQTAREKEEEKEKEGEIEKEVEDECLYRDGNDPGLAAVMDAYMNRIDPTPSPTSMDELKGYVDLMGPEVCIRAINVALDAKAANWNYIRRVLMNKASQGVRCIADWDDLEAEREAQKAQATPKQRDGRTDWAALAAQMEQEGIV